MTQPYILYIVIFFVVLFLVSAIKILREYERGVVFLLVYLVAAPLIRAVNTKDVHSLREMLSGLGPLSHVFNIPLSVIEKLSKIFSS